MLLMLCPGTINFNAPNFLNLNFCSLHGFSHFDSEPGFVRNIIWSGILISMWACSMMFLVQNYESFTTSKTVTSIDSTTAPLSDIRFPSVYICNINQVILTPFAHLFNIKYQSSLHWLIWLWIFTFWYNDECWVDLVLSICDIIVSQNMHNGE